VTSTEIGRALRDAAAVDPAGPGIFHVDLSPHYTVMGRPNGGYLQCVMANAATAAARHGSYHLHATSIATNFVHSADVGPHRSSPRCVGWAEECHSCT